MSTDTNTDENSCCWQLAGSRWPTATSQLLPAIFKTGNMSIDTDNHEKRTRRRAQWVPDAKTDGFSLRLRVFA